MVPPQFTSRLGFINPGLTLIMVWSLVDSSDSWAVMLNGVIGIMASWPLPAPRTWRCKENTCFDVGHEAILSDDQKPWQAGDLFLFK